MPFLGRKAKKDLVRLYVVSDFHASAPAWRKMLNAVRMNVYKADAVLYAGDLTGKAIVPVVQNDDSTWTAELLGQKRRPRSEQELLDLDRDIAALGYYPYHTTRAEVDALHGDATALDELFASQIRAQVAEWMEVAGDRLEGCDVPVFLIPGNDDPYEIDEPLNASQRAINVDRRVAEIPGGLEVMGLGLSSPTPWSTPREISEHDFREAIFRLADQVKDPRRTILLTHCPPYDSGLDVAPLLDENMRPIVSAGDLLRGPVGSTGVREAIEQINPLLSLHGHIHESAGEARVGQTLCLNPGSEAAYGIVRGYLIDVSADGIERWFRVEGWSPMTEPLPAATPAQDAMTEALALVSAAGDEGITVRLLGGMAVRVLCPDYPPRPSSGVQDIDLASVTSSRKALQNFLVAQGHQPDKNFNALYGHKQLYFVSGVSGRPIDVLIDRLEMCHELDFRTRISRMPYTLDPLDVLLSKLQIVKLNEKDVRDIVYLLFAYPVAGGAEVGVISLDLFRSLVADDWGWWRTVTMNLDKIRTMAGDPDAGLVPAGASHDPAAQAGELMTAAEEVPKSRRWKLRARVGDRLRWYQEPEESTHH